MSSSRKRSAVKKANENADYLNQRLMRAEHHASLMETFAKVAAVEHDKKQLEVYELKLKYCPEEMSDTEKLGYKLIKEKLESMKQLVEGVPT